MTPKIAPVDAIPTSPKLSFSDALLSFFRRETPNARPSMNGTVRAPVVAPEASKEMARNSGDMNTARTKIIPYTPVNSRYNGKL
ncbi:hypothetical protein SDC9_188445 [bioreactor metagenome]|uniref:Uncharacterized protein n=1 Tax=bioreactor metagenome TaxID=1076179 RepID=A0A645HPC3_9ZZZZ